MSTLSEILALCAVAATAVSSAAWAQGEMSADISVSRHVQSQGLLPATGDYVQYDITITNSGQSAISDQSLWVKLESQGGRTSSQASFSIPALEPGQGAQIHAGPFKTLEDGEHYFYAGINSQGDPEEPDSVSTNLASGAPVDSFAVYSPAFATTLPIGAGLAAAGAAIISIFFFRRKK
jgi:hypothetical protein